MTTRIMIINDDPAESALFAIVLQKKQYIVHCVNRSEEGLQECLRSLPDLVIIKYASFAEPPDGITLCHRLRNSPGLPMVPILLITANRREALDAGASAWLDLVFNIDHIVHRVDTLLSPIGDSI